MGERGDEDSLITTGWGSLNGVKLICSRKGKESARWRVEGELASSVSVKEVFGKTDGDGDIYYLWEIGMGMWS